MSDSPFKDQIDALQTERMKAWHEQKDILDGLDASKPVDAETRQKLERLDEAIDDADATVKALVAREKREQEAGALYEQDARIFGEPTVQAARDREQNVVKAWLKTPEHMRGDLEINIDAAAKERRMLRSGASHDEIRNAIAWDTGSIASAVPTDMARTLYEYMEASIAAFRIGAQQINTASGENITFPQLNAHGIATQVAGQGTALAGTDPTFANVTLGANKYGQLVPVANEVLTDAVFDVGSFLAQNIGRALGRLVDQHLIAGSGGVTKGMVGAGVTPVSGLTESFTGGTLTTTVGRNPTWLVDVVHTIPDSYRGNAAWLFRDSTIADVRKLRDGAGGTEGAFLWEPSRTAGLQNGQPDTLLGYPVYSDPNIASLASNNAIGAFGDFSTYYIRQVGNVQIDSSTERYFDTDQTAFRGKWRGDGAYIDTSGVTAIVNAVS